MGGKRIRLSGKAVLPLREGPGGKASPGIWGENYVRGDTPGGPPKLLVAGSKGVGKGVNFLKRLGR